MPFMNRSCQSIQMENPEALYAMAKKLLLSME